MWTTIIVIAIVVSILAGATAYIIRAKKKGVKCIGCPAGSSCSGHCCSGAKPTTDTTECAEQLPTTVQTVGIVEDSQSNLQQHDTCQCAQCNCQDSCSSNSQ